MSRAALGTINPTTTSGTQLAALLSNRDAAENSGHAGTGRPAYASAGMVYTDDSFSPPRLFIAVGPAGPDTDLSSLFGPRPGTMRITAEVRLPSGWLWADGAAVARATWPDLFNSICPAFTGSVANGSATITAVSEDLRTLGLLGAKIEGLGVPGTATVSAISASTITLSLPATSDHAATPLRIFPHGNGNGSTTFNTPNAKGRNIIARQDMGGVDAALITVAGAGFDGTRIGAAGGAQTVALAVVNLPAHSHPASSSASLISGAGSGTATTDAAPNHTHGSGSLVTTSDGSHNHTSGLLKTTASSVSVQGAGGANVAGFGSGSQLSLTGTVTFGGTHSHVVNGNTSSAGTHSHVVTTTIALTSLVLTVSTTTSNTGSGTPTNNVQPGIVENVVVKT